MPNTGDKIGPYILIKRLGAGAMGEVWLAENRAKFATTQVAVKLPLDEQVDHSLIEKEAQLWAKASGHPNVLPIIEANEYDGQIVIVSEYTPGGSLEKLLKDSGGKLPIEQTVEIIIGILKGLEYLHSKGIIHRDLKPDNVLMQGETPRLADFGISRIIKTTLHATSSAGTPYFMSPEAFKRVHTKQTDIWSMGVMLYQLLTGDYPFTGNSLGEIYDAIREEEPPPLPTEIPLKLQAVIKKALEKELSDRYQTADAMAKELREFSQKNSDETLKIPLYEVPPTEPSPKIDTPVTDKSDSVVRNVKVATQTNETEATIRPVAPQPKADYSNTYIIFSALGFLLIVFGVIYWSSKNNNEVATNSSTISNTKTSPTVTPSTITTTKLIPFRKGDKFGFSDENKKIIIEPKYDAVSPFFEELAIVSLNKKFGFIDNTGKEIIPLKYDAALMFSKGMAIVVINRKGGFIDKVGREIIPLKYDVVSRFSDSEDLALVQLNGKSGFINRDGREVIPLKYDAANIFSEGLASVKLNNQTGFIDKTGKVILQLKYTEASPFYEGLAVVRLDGKFGFINKMGREIISLKYDDALPFSESLAVVSINKKYGFIDKADKEIIPFKFDNAFSFSEGLAQVKVNNKNGFIDKTGREVISLKYDKTDKFFNDLAQVELNGKRFYIDKNGTEYYEP